jgi:hypothetical protein
VAPPDGGLGGCKAYRASRGVITMNRRHYGPNKGEPKKPGKSRRYRTRLRDDDVRHDAPAAFPIRSLFARYRDLQNRHYQLGLRGP